MLYDKYDTVTVHNKYYLSSKLTYPKSNIKIPKKLLKVLIFDLDETIGSFHEAAILWKLIETNLQKDFNTLMDLYPEFLRFGILQMFEFIMNKKRKGKCDKLYLYTNNINSPVFPNFVEGYLKYKLRTTDIIFDKIIGAFKVNNQIIEPNRTTHKKTYNDFINCAVLTDDVDICFIDDKYYSKMDNEKIYYIQPSPYYHSLSNKEIIERFSKSEFNIHDNMNKLNSVLNVPYIDYKYQDNMSIIDKKEQKIYKKIMYYLREFFYIANTNEKTKKSRIQLGRFTRKRKK
jgi:hypothetical protein